MPHRHTSRDIDHQLAEHLDSVWGDPATWVANGLQWMHLPMVSDYMHAQISGDPCVTPLEWFFSVVQTQHPIPVGRALVLGCGQGHVERQIAKYGWAREILATDLSAKVLEVARANAAAAGASIKYVQADMNCLPVGHPGFELGSFDVVLGVSCVHHCADLEHLYASILKLLAPSGWLFLDEYVGPDRFQYPNSQVRLMNQLLDILPERLRKTMDDRIKGNLWRPSVKEVVEVDPSEAIRSCDILPLLDRHFDIHEHRPYGGALLRVVLADIAQNFKDKASEAYLHSLLQAEDDLFRAGRLQRDLACVIARVPTAASTSSTGDH
ncbi:class I SAM-dependent methyltransferase [Acidovorax sp. D2M1]|uniref:Class I SAM-dependent methyltransferase n=1 Tax=Acidovorax benzenivorans TaxID=2987520 RepID=A0ABT5RW57_9BURK|nr:class I SAM-dependent methyltransferase [Acidovorax benzenivorans]MDD2177941.1 class I SAM-dependent methyltransferase [Acidovorax benzenivorans]